MTPPSSPRPLRTALIAAVLFALLTPWVLRPWFLADDDLPRDTGIASALVNVDLQLNLWILGWVAHAAVHAPSQLFDGNVFYPSPRAMIGSENMLSHLPVTAPVLAATGSVLSVLKAMALESFVLSGVALAALVYHHTADLPAALIAGAAFTLVPWRPRALPQPQYLAMQYLPWAMLAIDAWLARGRVRALVALAASLAMQALTGVYLGFFTFAAVPAYAAARLLSTRAPLRRWLGVAAGGIAGALLTLPAAWPYLQGRDRGVLPSQDPALLEVFSATPATFVSRGFLDTAGVVAPLLALLGVAFLWRRRRPDDPAPPVGATWVFTLVAVLLACGPTLHLFGLAVPLPYRLLYRFVPGFQTARAPMRGVHIVATGLAILAGYAFATLTRRWRPPLRWAATAWLVLAATVWAAPFPIETMAARLGDHAAPVYRWLASQPPRGGVLEVPAWRGESDLVGNARNVRYMVDATIHWQPILNGWTAYAPPTTPFVADVVRRLPDPAALATLVDCIDVGTVVLHHAALTPDEATRWHTIPPGLTSVARFGDDEVLRVDVTPARPWRTGFLARAAAPAADTLEGTPTAPLAPACRRATLTLEPPAAMASALALMPIPVHVVNDGDCVWPALGVRDEGLVLLRYRWISPSGVTHPNGPDGRLARDVAPHTALDERLMVGAASGEIGAWTLVVTLEQNGDATPLARAEAVIPRASAPQR